MSDEYLLRTYSAADESALLALNEASVEYTSPLDGARLSLLLDQGCSITVATDGNRVAGMLMAFTDGSDYNSVNYQWFSQRLKNFLYIDRIVIDAGCRGQGIGGQFYTQLKAQAAASGLYWLVAEINSVPPNDASLRFHARYGFSEVGRQSIGDKTVSLQACGIA